MAALRWLLRSLPVLLLAGWALGAAWLSTKRLPPGLHVAGSWSTIAPRSVHFLRDLSAADGNGAPLIEQQIDAEILGMIARARQLVLLDSGLFGDLPAAGPGAQRLRTALPVAATIAEALARAKTQHPDLAVLVLTDPSTQQMDGAAHLLERLATAGVEVIPVDTARLRPADAPFMALWNLCCRWWAGALPVAAWPNPLQVGPSSVSMQAWGQLRGYQRSHRQLLLADDGAGALVALLFSHALHAEAGLQSATALQLAGEALEPLIESEFALAQFSGWSDGGAMQVRARRLLEQQRRVPVIDADPSARARVVTEAAIGSALVERIDATRGNDQVAIAALYLAHRELIRSLLDAAHRGVQVRLLLDPGKDGYGFQHSGLPNREVASELIAASDGGIRVRWYRTHGEQFSPGFVLVQSDARAWLMTGTSDLSRRDLGDFNLAAAAIAELPMTSPAVTDALNWFDALWYNRATGGTEYTTDADVYAEASQLRYWQYRLFEVTGLAF